MKFLLFIALVFANNNGLEFLSNAVNRLLPKKSQTGVAEIVDYVLNRKVSEGVEFSDVQLLRSLLDRLGENGIFVSSTLLKKDKNFAAIFKEAIDGDFKVFLKISDDGLDFETLELVGFNAIKFIRFIGMSATSEDRLVAGRSVRILAVLVNKVDALSLKSLCLKLLSKKQTIEMLIPMVIKKDDKAANALAQVFSNLSEQQKTKFGYTREYFVKLYANTFKPTMYDKFDKHLHYFDSFFESENRIETLKFLLDEWRKDSYDDKTKALLLKAVFNSTYYTQHMNALKHLMNFTIDSYESYLKGTFYTPSSQSPLLENLENLLQQRKESMAESYKSFLNRFISESEPSFTLGLLEPYGKKLFLFKEIINFLKKRKEVEAKQLALDLVRRSGNKKLFRLQQGYDFNSLFKESFDDIIKDGERLMESFQRSTLNEHYDVMSSLGLHRKVD